MTAMASSKAASRQAKALIGDACVSLARDALAAGKPLVMEKLDFAGKKAELEGADPKRARMLTRIFNQKGIGTAWEPA